MTPPLVTKKRDSENPNPALKTYFGLVTTAAITAATAAAAAVFTTRTTAATAAAASRTLFARTGHVDREGATVELLTVQRVNGLLRFIGAAHGDETETTRTAAHAIHHQIGFDDGAVRGERVRQVVFSGVEGKISDKQFCAHVMLILSETNSALFQTVPDCRVSNHH